MIFEEAMVAYLLENVDLALLISNRLHEDVLPQEPTLPAVVWQRISNLRFYSQSGPSGLARPRVQFACWSTTKLEAIRVANAVLAALDGFSGLMSTVEVGAAFNEGEGDYYDPVTGMRRVLLDFEIYHKE